MKSKKQITKNYYRVKEYPFTWEWLFAVISAELALISIIFPSVLWLFSPLSFLCLILSITTILRGKREYYYWKPDLMYDAETDGVIDDSYFPKI